jgi:MYXO-CTERM domain-containing protein
MAAKHQWILPCVIASAGLISACFGRGSDVAEAAPQDVKAGPDATLAAVVALEGGCTAVKVGPKHLLVSARCVANKSAYEMGKALRFRAGSAVIDAKDAPPANLDDAGANNASSDAGVAAVDAGSEMAADAGAENLEAMTDAGDAPPMTKDEDAGSDAGNTPPESSGDVFEETIAQVRIHPSYLAKCGAGACDRGRGGGVEVADIALIVLEREVARVPSAPIDLDPVTVGDGVLVLGYGCDATADGATRLHVKEMNAAGADAVLHEGSPYGTAPDLASTLLESYVVTRGPGDTKTKDALAACSDRDFGAPLLRADGSAVVGVTSNVTNLSQQRLPVTTIHSRVDGSSRNKVGEWLAKAGVETTTTCSTTEDGCPPQADDTAHPPDDDTAEAQPGVGDGLPEGNEPEGEVEGSQAQGRPSSKAHLDPPKVDNDGCSASPGTSSRPAGVVLFALGAIAATAARRRRRAWDFAQRYVPTLPKVMLGPKMTPKGLPVPPS